ncbi:proteasome accessory factor PafA2 family protein [Demequina litorisediminis]|nr:proteasome accessory factor PafA2 family protein [Demequina litorisediminis]
MSQRADYMEAELGLETTLRRPIVNTRDEPHAERARWRRLHVIIGDANCLQVPTYLKIGTTSLVLSAIEADDERLDALVLADPVSAVQQVSHDLTLRAALPLASGEQATAIEIQRALLEICRDYASDADDALVVARWEQILAVLARDPMEAAADVEWVARLRLLGRLRDKHASVAADGAVTPLAWDAPMLAALDLQWSRLGDGWAARLEGAGQTTVLVDAQEVAAAVTRAPQDTRARLRGGMVAARPEPCRCGGLVERGAGPRR